MSDILRHLDEEKYCPHCNKRLIACEAPPIHVGDGLGWGSEVLFICLNDECPVFHDGFEKVEARYGHHASYRYMELPGSKEKNYMMVGNADAFKGCVISKEEILAQNSRYAEQKALLARLDGAEAAGDTTVPLAVLLNEGTAKEKRRQAATILEKIGTVACIDPIRNHSFRDPAMEHAAGVAATVILKRNFKKECPHCAEIVKAQAKVCRFCGGEL